MLQEFIFNFEFVQSFLLKNTFRLQLQVELIFSIEEANKRLVKKVHLKSIEKFHP